MKRGDILSDVNTPTKSEKALPSNSMSAKSKPSTPKTPVEKKAKQIISNPQVRKKSELEKGMVEVKSFMIDDIVMPRVKDMVMDIISGIFDMAQDAILSAIFHEPTKARWNSDHERKRGKHHVPYNSMYDTRNKSMRKRGLDYDEEEDVIDDYRDVIIPDLRTRNDIEEEIYDTFEDQGVISVGDVNFIMGITVGSYTDEDYGWRNLNGMRFKQLRGGRYKLEMSKPRPI